MKLVASSQPGAVEEDDAVYLLTERAVYTRAVCRELLEEGKKVRGGRRARVALGHLLAWLSAKYTGGEISEPRTDIGLDKMIVPKGLEALFEEIRDGARVCGAFFLLTTADHNWEADDDRAELQKKLGEYWAKHRSTVQSRYVLPKAP